MAGPDAVVADAPATGQLDTHAWAEPDGSAGEEPDAPGTTASDARDAGGADATADAGRPDTAADAGSSGVDGAGGGTDAGASPPDAESPPPGGKAVVYVGGGTTVAIYSADLSTGALTFRSMVEAGQNARIAAVDQTGARAYVHTGINGESRILSFQIRPEDGGLVRVDNLAVPYYSSGYGGDQLLLSPTQRWLLVKGTSSGRTDASVSAVGPDGKLGALKTLGLRNEAVTWDATGRCVFGIGTSIDQYSFDVSTGAIAASNPQKSVISAGHTITAASIHPNGKWAYGYYTSGVGEIGLFNLDSSRCTMTEQAYVPRPADPVIWSSLVIHPSGRFLYAFGALLSGNISTELQTIDLFAIDGSTGSLKFVKRETGGATHGLISHGLRVPLMLPELMIVGGGIPPNYPKLGLSVYRVNQSDGTLTPAGTRIPAATGQLDIDFIFPQPPSL